MYAASMEAGERTVSKAMALTQDINVLNPMHLCLELMPLVDTHVFRAIRDTAAFN